MEPAIVPFSDRAVLVNFEQRIDYQIHGQVMDLLSELKNTSIAGLTFTIPAYCSLTVGYDPKQISYRDLKQVIRHSLSQPAAEIHSDVRRLDLPVCYEREFAPDLKEISTHSGFEPEEIIRMHTGKTYRVFMLGFLPGFPYMGILEEGLQLPRKHKPRMKVAERSVGIAGLQTGIYPAESPGGWNIIGRTPVPVFDVANKDPFLFQPGDQVRFRPVDSPEYSRIRQAIRDKTFDFNSLYVKDP
jgi:inhibitor of KinA